MTKKWWTKTEPLYRRFSGQGRDADEAREMFDAETYGKSVSPNNRYLSGKRNMDATVTMWREDIGGDAILTKYELLNDRTLRGIVWWLKKILKTIRTGSVAWAFRPYIDEKPLVWASGLLEVK